LSYAYKGRLMIAKFNPSGTHLHKGKLKIRLDIYPVEASKTFASQRVDKLNRDYTLEELAQLDALTDTQGFNEALGVLKLKIGTHKETNPCLCHFITIDADTTKAQLTQIVQGIFDGDTVNSLDDTLSKDDRGRVSRVMGAKCGSGREVKQVNLDTLNTRFAGLEVIVGTN